MAEVRGFELWRVVRVDSWPEGSGMKFLSANDRTPLATTSQKKTQPHALKEKKPSVSVRDIVFIEEIKKDQLKKRGKCLPKKLIHTWKGVRFWNHSYRNPRNAIHDTGGSGRAYEYVARGEPRG